MKIRTTRERIIQTLAYEAGGLAVITPLYGLATGHTTGDAIVLLAAVSITCMAWAAAHNTLFDFIEAHFTGRVASDRPHGMRAIHAFSHETSSILVSTPVIMMIGEYGLWDALLIDIGLTIAYTCYAYFFHMGFDVLRPVQEHYALAFSGGQPSLSGNPRPAPRVASSPWRAPRGVHLMVDGFGAPRRFLEDQALLFKLLIDLPGAFGMTAVAMPKLVFTNATGADIPAGISGYAMLNGGHITFHAFPDLGLVSVDLYSCSCDANRQAIADILIAAFHLAGADVHLQERGLRPPERKPDHSHYAKVFDAEQNLQRVQSAYSRA